MVEEQDQISGDALDTISSRVILLNILTPLVITPRTITNTGYSFPLVQRKPSCVTLEDMQEAVIGYIEVIHLGASGFVLIINEEGKIHGLPPNEIATKLFRDLTVRTEDIIVGIVILMRKELLT